MAIGTRLTLAGARLLAKALQGKQLKFTRGAFGDAKVNGKLVEPTDEQQDNLNALINERMSLPIYSFKFGDNGDFYVTVKVKNENLTSTFKAAECGIFAKDPDTGSEILYGYCYEGNDGDKIYAKSSYCVLEYYLEFTTTIGNAKNVTCVVNIQEKIKAGDGLSRMGDTINVNAGTGIGISQYNNVYLKRATADEKGGVIITGGDGLKMDGETIKAAVGTGLNISDAGNIYLKRASATEKGGVIITGEDGLVMDGDTLKATGGDYESRIRQLEINQSNLYMVMNAEHELGITANLLLVEDFIKCDCTDQSNVSVFSSIPKNKMLSYYDNYAGTRIGYKYTMIGHGADQEITTQKVHRGYAPDVSNVGLTIYTEEDFDEAFSRTGYLSGAVQAIYRSTVGIKTGKYAYGPATATKSTLLGKPWNGTTLTEHETFELPTTKGQESKFDITTYGSLTSDGYFTII